MKKRIFLFLIACFSSFCFGWQISFVFPSAGISPQKFAQKSELLIDYPLDGRSKRYFKTESNEASKKPLWRKFSPELEEFAADFPLNNFEGEQHLFENQFIFARYQAATVEAFFHIFSARRKNEIPWEAARQFAQKYNAASRDFNPGGAKGTRFSFNDQTGFEYEIALLETENRFYIFSSVTKSGAKSAKKSFFDRIKFDAKSPNAANARRKSFARFLSDGKIRAGSFQEVFCPRNASGEPECGTGISGPDFGINSPLAATPTPTPTPDATSDAKVRISSKPRALYTEAARAFNIQGQVVLDVVFLENGEIGEITPVELLPFGLTEQAIEAARKIKFKPASKNGVSYPVKRQVSYNFTIY